jgi:hypothetical protein
MPVREDCLPILPITFFWFIDPQIIISLFRAKRFVKAMDYYEEHEEIENP